MKVRLTLVAILVAVGIGAALHFSRTAGKSDDSSQIATSETCVSSASEKVSPLAVPVVAAQGLALPTNQTPTVRGTLPFVLTSEQPLGKRLRLVAEGMGAKTVSVLSRNALLIEADASTRARLSADGRFTKVEEFAPAGKIQPALAEMISSGAEAVEVSIISLSEADRGLVQSCLESGGGAMLEGCINEGDTLRARLPAALVATLAARGDVRWMEKFERPHFMNDIAVNEPQMNVREVWDTHGLTGVGQVITTSDTGIDTGDIATMHEDLRNNVKGLKVVSGCNKTDSNGHGTHTAGSIVGNGTKSDGKIRGSAYGASLYAWFCCGTDGYVYTPTAMDELYRNKGAWPASIHSASWGSPVDGEYTSSCVNHDRYVWENPEFLPVFSAGNEGCNNYGTIVRKCSIDSPGSAKNVLTVGATQNARKGGDGGWGNGNPKTTAIFSSRGPCQDGRIKPDIAAPGVGILSTRSHGVDYSYGNYNEFYAYDSGTSMSCPLTAGAVALVRQWLVEKKGFVDADGTRPTAALMKAVITGGAKDAPVPNNDQGWGRVDLESTLFPSDRAVKLVDRIPFADGEVFEYLIETTNAAPLDVQLCWVDYPGSASASQKAPKLVNDLDLTVEPLDGVSGVWLGNGGTTADTVNNMESVRIASAEPNKYAITVTCRNVAYDHEDGGAAALYIRGAFDPKAVLTGIDRVRIQRDPGTTYSSLDQALAAVQEGDKVEVLRPVSLKKPVTIGVNCTIVATNDNPEASVVNCLTGGLMIEDGARVLFQNVVFTNAASVTVATGGKVALSGVVAVGPVTTSDDTGIELAGAISRNVVVHSPNQDVNGRFGTYSCSDFVASDCAKFFENPSNDELGGIAVSESRSLVWGAAVVPDESARVKLIVGGQSKNFRSLHTLFKYVACDSEISVIKDIGLSLPESITNRIVLVGGTPGVTVTASNAAGLVIAGGTLVISNLSLTGSSSDALFRVGEFGSDRLGELILGRGAEVRDFAVTSPTSYSGAIRVLNGCATLNDGAALVRCQAQGSDSYGGGIYAYGENAKVALAGGFITGCAAMKGGGAISALSGAELAISGSPFVKGNTVGGKEDDIYSGDSVKVVDPVTSSAKTIGVDVEGLALAGDAFATNTAPVVLNESERKTTAAAFFSAKDATLRATFDTTGRSLLWEVVPDDKTTDEPSATVRVVYPDATTNYYATLDIACEDLKGDCRVELMKTYTDLDQDLAFSHSVTLASDPQFADSVLLDRIAGTIIVKAGATLTISNLIVSGCYYEGFGRWRNYSQERLVYVDGGSLVLEKDGGVWMFDGNGSRDASAVVVRDGIFTMKDGSFVDDCWNNYVDTVKDVNSGTGGGVLVDVGSTAYLLGGEVVNCRSAYGGGLSLCNESIARLSESFVIAGNSDLNENPSDLLVEDQSYLYLDAPLSEGASIGRVCGYRADTNLAAIARNWTNAGSLASLIADAEKFFSNDILGVRGIAVTNETEDALVVWSTAVSPTDKSYVAPDGKKYFAASEVPEPPPEPSPSVTTNYPTPIAFKSIERLSETTWRLVVTDRVEWCNYALTHTDDLKKGFTTTNDWVQADHAGAWTNEVTVPSGQYFWKALGTWGIVPEE